MVETWRIPLVTRVSNPAMWRERLEELIYRWQTRKLDTPSSQVRMLCTLGWALEALTVERTENANGADDERITALLRAMQDPGQLAALSRLSIIELAHWAGMGVTSFRQRFRAVTACTPHQYIRERQVHQAAYLLRQTAQPVREVAQSLGFDDPSHFSRLFHQVMGCYPAHFRRREADAR
jgi:AraC-like DNA-binding protein